MTSRNCPSSPSIHHLEMDARIMLTTHNRTLSTTTHEIVSPKWQIQCALSMAAASDSQYIRVVLYTMVVFESFCSKIISILDLVINVR